MEKVRQELDSLKKQLIETPEVDESVEPLAPLILDIDQILGNPGEISFDHHREVMHKLEKALLLFEVGHEKLMKQVRVVIDSLNEVGI